jgi:CHASE3 domain sensor protein
MKFANYLKQKASNGLVLFVFLCTIITVVLLFMMQKAEDTKQNLHSKNDFKEYLEY